MTGLEFDRLISALNRICVALMLIGFVIVLSGCAPAISAETHARYNHRFDTMYMLAQLPMPPPTIVYKQLGPKTAGLTDCYTRTISIDYRVAATQPDFVINKVIPHEYAHLVSCYYRGGTSGIEGYAHDNYWKQWVAKLDGDPEYI